MHMVFPFGFPLGTGFYMVFFVLTLAIHVVFMNYVLGGASYLAVRTLIRRRTPGGEAPLCASAVIRDWLPFMLGGAITAGVAPLLFVQILYKQAFYTANLLLFHRWMSILPVLIVAFYLLYLLKTRAVEKRPTVATVLVVVAFACFAYTALAWTENHMLSLRGTSEHAGFYAAGRMMYRAGPILPRLLMWFIGALPTLAVLVAWQLRYAAETGRTVDAGDPRRLAMTALGGLAVAIVCGVVYMVIADSQTRQGIFSLMALPYGIIALAGVALQVWGWLPHLKSERFDKRSLAFATLGMALTVVGMAVVREAIRVAHFDVAALEPLHKQALETKISGLPAFLAFFVINAVLVTWCFVLVRKGRIAGTTGAAE
jgi:hypothetical protein